MASKLFQVAEEAVRRAAKNRFSRTTVGKLVEELDKIDRGGGSEYRARELIRQLERYQYDNLMRQIEASGSIERYSASSHVIDQLRRLLAHLGPLGRVLLGVIDGNTKTFTDAQLKAARELLRSHGEEVLTRPGTADYQRGIDAAIQALERDESEPAPRRPWASRKRELTKNLLEEKRIRDEQVEIRRRQQIEEERRNHPDTRMQSVLEPEYKISKIYRTPASSNVFSFMYDYMTSTMYVRFKAPRINTKSISNVKGRGKMIGMSGKLGSTVVGKTDDPGPLYAYYDVPVRVFKRLISARSAGGAVWDELRIRGTAWGHKFRYGLIGSPPVPGENGELAHYVPRRATRRGFRTRALKGGGNRWVRSTLPEVYRGDPGERDPGDQERGR